MKKQWIYALLLCSALATSNAVLTKAETPETSQQDEKILNPSIKTQARASMKVVASGGRSAGFTTSADLLDHSLQDKPTPLSYGTTTTKAAQIQKSSEHKKIISDLKAKLKGTSLVTYNSSDSTALTSTTDLYLAYNKVNYSIKASKSGNTWTVNITYTDTYDFDWKGWKSYSSSLTHNAGVALNDWGYLAQKHGAVVPYTVTVKTSETFTL